MEVTAGENREHQKIFRDNRPYYLRAGADKGGGAGQRERGSSLKRIKRNGRPLAAVIRFNRVFVSVVLTKIL